MQNLKEQLYLLQEEIYDTKEVVPLYKKELQKTKLRLTSFLQSVLAFASAAVVLNIVYYFESIEGDPLPVYARSALGLNWLELLLIASIWYPFRDDCYCIEPHSFWKADEVAK